MNFSLGEIIVVLLIALLVIKPEELPNVALTLGKLARSIRRSYAKMKDEWNGLIDSTEKKVALPLLLTQEETATTKQEASVNHEQKREQ